MADFEKLKILGFSQYEITCYMALAANHPLNGSQLSRISGIARSRVYDVLRKLMSKGVVMEVQEGQYVPLPPEELYKRLQSEFESSLDAFKQQLEGTSPDASYEFIWMIKGYDRVIAKARAMICAATNELYVRLFPESGKLLAPDLKKAEKRGVGIRYISMGPAPATFEIQVEHPGGLTLVDTIGGRSFDIISDKSEALVGIFEKDRQDQSPISWTRNRLFVTANRDSLQHDFYHYFLEKIYDHKEPLTEHEQRIYAFIKADK
ncbi:MAG: TrmB family transcriptional regulator [Desulfobacteraceae bacterium]|nr:TrmB family transcriptional regulator [Desulfobacteraceae bacterium]